MFLNFIGFDERMSKAKKIFFLTTALSGGGAEAVCVNLANALASRGLDITIVVLNQKKSVYHNEINENVGYKVLNVSNLRYSFVKLFLLLTKEKPDKVVSFSYELSVALLFLKFFFKNKPFVLSRNINNLDRKYEKKGLKGKIIKKLIHALYVKNDYVVNQCYAMKEQFDHKFPSLFHKNSVIYNPLNSKFDFSFEEVLKYRSNNSEPYFLCVGRLSFQKSFSLALEGFSIFLNDYPSYKLVIIGEGELEDDLKSRAEELGISTSVIFKGFSRDLSKYYANAEGVLLTSEFEGFPNVLVEAIAHGTPVISVDCQSGPSEIIEKGVNGILLNSRSSDELSSAMINLVTNQLDRYSIYQSSRRFSIDKIVCDWEKVL